MKDFDVERAERAQVDRTFKLGGETFTRKATVRPEATEPWEGVTAVSTQTETLAAIDATIRNMIEPGDKNEAHARWKKLRQREEDAVSLGDLIELITWLVEEQTARPTEPQRNFSVVPDDTGTTSTEGSSSPETPEASTA